MKYRLLSGYGNRVIYIDSEKEKNQLLDKGFYIDEKWQEEKVKQATTAKRRKAVKKDAGKTSDKD